MINVLIKAFFDNTAFANQNWRLLADCLFDQSIQVFKPVDLRIDLLQQFCIEILEYRFNMRKHFHGICKGY